MGEHHPISKPQGSLQDGESGRFEFPVISIKVTYDPQVDRILARFESRSQLVIPHPKAGLRAPRTFQPYNTASLLGLDNM